MGVETIIQGGAVGISVALIALISKIWMDSSRHSEKITDVVEKNAGAMTSLSESIKANTIITRETRELIANLNGKRK